MEDEELERLDQIEKEVEEQKENYKQIDQLPITEQGKVDAKAMSTFKNTTLKDIQSKFSNGQIDADEGMKQIVNVASIVEATNDPKLKKTLIKNASKSLKSYTLGITYKDDQKKLEHRQQRNEAFYKAFRPILEFDLSHLIGKKRKRIVTKDPQTGRKTVEYKDIEEDKPKSYQDRSYGLSLMMVMIALFIVPYCIANIVLAVGRMINAMFECFAQFGRTAFWICTSIGGIAIVGIFVYVVLLIVQSLFGVHIFNF